SSIERLQQQRGRAIDVTGAERQQAVAGTRSRSQVANAVLDERRPRNRHSGTHLREGIDDELAGDALDRFLPCRVDVCDSNCVCCRERDGELTGEMARSRVQMRLEEHEDAATVLTQRSE